MVLSSKLTCSSEAAVTTSEMLDYLKKVSRGMLTKAVYWLLRLVQNAGCQAIMNGALQRHLGPASSRIRVLACCVVIAAFN